MNRPFRKEEQLPPPALANESAEMAVLGKLLIDGRLWFDIADRLTLEHFSSARHRAIFKALQTLAARGSPLLKQLVPSCIGDDQRDDIGLEPYLAALISEAPQESIGDFVDAVIEAATRRQVIQESETLADKMRAASFGETREILQDAIGRLSVAGSDSADDGAAFGDVLEGVVDCTNEILTTDGDVGLKTGLTALDELIGPMMPGQLIVIAGSAGMGKTSLALQVCVMVAQQGIPVEIFSLEMAADELGRRALSSFSEISSDKIAEANLTNHEMEKLVDAQRRFKDLPIYVDDRPSPLTSTLLSRAARAQAKRSVRLFVTDHMRKVRPDNPRADERVRLEQTVADHKNMAKRLKVPWILLSHISRVDVSGVKTATDIRRPTMASLYGSSAVENEADAVVFVHRPGVILEDVKPADGAKHKPEWEADLLHWSGRAELILGKHRSRRGRGIRTVNFDETRTWFGEAT